MNDLTLAQLLFHLSLSIVNDGGAGKSAEAARAKRPVKRACSAGSAHLASLVNARVPCLCAQLSKMLSIGALAH